ncbi:50S ribosomal protein L1 [Candidatus Woesearchaeota archaeon]|nr:50S ribosomal protein L1 [Candidatus Woesearchaeota archaeon]
MDKAQVKQTLKIIKDNSPKRNFKQSIDIVVNLKDIDLKKQDNKVDVFAQLHFSTGKKTKICGLVGPELKDQAEKHFDKSITATDFSKFSDKKVLKKLAKEHTFFVAQANIMPQVATSFGRSLGPRGKMPNPKAGCVVPPNANLQAVAEKLQKTVRIRIDAAPIFQSRVGTEEMDEEHIIDNIMTLYNALVHALPSDIHNIREVYLKMTMGQAFKVGEEYKPQEKEAPKEKPKKKPTPKKKAKADPETKPKKEVKAKPEEKPAPNIESKPETEDENKSSIV